MLNFNGLIFTVMLCDIFQSVLKYIPSSKNYFFSIAAFKSLFDYTDFCASFFLYIAGDKELPEGFVYSGILKMSLNSYMLYEINSLSLKAGGQLSDKFILNVLLLKIFSIDSNEGHKTSNIVLKDQDVQNTAYELDQFDDFLQHGQANPI